MGLEQAGDHLGRDQRHVAGEDEHGLAARLDQRQRRPDRAAGAVGLGLDHGLDVLGQAGGDVAPRRDDRRDAAGPGLARGEDRPGDHRPPADGMQHLRQRGAHARALARRHDQDQRRTHPRIVEVGGEGARWHRTAGCAEVFCRGTERRGQGPAGEDQVDADQEADRPVGGARRGQSWISEAGVQAVGEGDGDPGQAHEEEVDAETRVRGVPLWGLGDQLRRRRSRSARPRSAQDDVPIEWAGRRGHQNARR